MQRKLLGTISVDFDATSQLLIIYSTFVNYLKKKWEYNEEVRQLFVHIIEAYDSVGLEVSYNILIDLGIHRKLVRLIKMCRNETYSRDRIGKHMSDMFPIRKGLKQGEALSP
jgi:hypothetical protein